MESILSYKPALYINKQGGRYILLLTIYPPAINRSEKWQYLKQRRKRKMGGASNADDIRRKAFEEARWHVAKQIFPNFIALVLMGVVDELDCNKMKNFHLTQGEKARLVKSIGERIQHYCDLSNQGALDPFDTRECFEKQTGMDFSKMYI